MGDMKTGIPVGLLLSAVLIVIYFVAQHKMFKGGQLLVSTSECDAENVKKKHLRSRIVMLLLNFLPLVLALAVEVFGQECASGEVMQAMRVALRQYYTVILVMLFAFGISSIDGERSDHARAFEEPYILTRYMIYPKLPVSAFVLTGIVCSFAGGIAGIGYSFYESNITIRNGLDFPFGVLCFVLELVLLYLANYGIIGWYDSTSNDFLFDKVDYAEYDKAAKRYYGIWRNRLILANVAAGAQLILGGFVTLTNVGEHLMGIRILGLVLLAIVFIYILIQSREFEDPVVVKGMVYPSEKKRVTLKWVILSAIAVYIIGAIILL